MKWLKNREIFLEEAKIGDIIFKRQSSEVAKVWGEKYLEYEEIDPTEKIKQGKWKLSEDDKLEVLGAFFEADMKKVFSIFGSIPEHFAKILKDSIDINLITIGTKEKWETILRDFNINKPKIDAIVSIFDPIFRKLSVNETKSDEIISKDENGRPIRGEDGQMIKISKVKGDPVYSNSLVNINGFIDDYRRSYTEHAIDVDFSNGHIQNIISIAKEDIGREFRVNFEIFDRDLYLKITHNPKDILNMSISKFYSSCQHLYSGGYRTSLLGNIFDPNSIPAFLVFDTPIYWGDEVISDQLPLSRMIIRNIESFGDSPDINLFFDRSYPDRMKDIFDKIIEKYSDNKNVSTYSGDYIFSPDIGLGDNKIANPYMDRLRAQRVSYIGVNTKSLHLTANFDWSKVKISPKAKVETVIIETPFLPENFFKANLNLEWIKIRFMRLKDLSSFSKITTESIAFDKCEFDGGILSDLKKLKKLRLSGCDVVNFDINILSNLEDLQILYTLDPLDNLRDKIGKLNLKNLEISGDLLSNSDNSKFIKEIKKSGTTVKITGPKI